jgi:hypothetical protein
VTVKDDAAQTLDNSQMSWVYSLVTQALAKPDRRHQRPHLPGGDAAPRPRGGGPRHGRCGRCQCGGCAGAAAPEPRRAAPPLLAQPQEREMLGMARPTCTAACEASADRPDFTETTAANVVGAACPTAAPDCADGDGDCVAIDCDGNWNACTAACEASADIVLTSPRPLPRPDLGTPARPRPPVMMRALFQRLLQVRLVVVMMTVMMTVQPHKPSSLCCSHRRY